MESFIFRTTGYNSIRTLLARLNYFKALSNDLLSCMPLELRLRGKSTRMSYGQAIYYADITLREGMSLEEALESAKELQQQRLNVGFNQEALDAAARAGLANGAFEESVEDIREVVEEFFPEEGNNNSTNFNNNSSNFSNSNSAQQPVVLTEVLARKLQESAAQLQQPA